MADLQAPQGKKFKVINEEFERPTDRRALVAAVERIVEGGGVLRLVIEAGAPIRVRRAVQNDDGDPGVPESLPEEDLVSSVRNADMEEFPPPAKVTSFEYIFRAFRVLMTKRLRPRAILVNNKDDLAAWLHVERFADMQEVYGVEVVTHKEIPHEVLVLVACPLDLPDTVAFSLRLEMNKETKR